VAADDRSWTPPQLRRIGLTQREFRELERERRIHDHVRRGAGRGAPRGRDRGGPRGRDRRLTREDIVNAAVALADAEGVDAVSMRRLARDLRAGAMSLYWHIESKEELLDLMLEQMEAEIQAPEPSGDWRADLRTYARSIRAVLMRHPWAIDLMSARPPTGPNDARNGDRMFGVFMGLGVETRVAVWLAMTFLTYVIGSVHQQIREIRLEREMAAASAELSDEEVDAIREEFARRFSESSDYPNIARLITDDIDPDDPQTRDERFEFGLEVMLDGIAARLA
jgi:AcrR family transcriptional regulator